MYEMKAAPTVARQINRKAYQRALRNRETEVSHNPLEIQIELTNHCNIHCIFCAREHDEAYLTREAVGHIPMEMVGDLAGMLETAEIVMPQGFGEPFLHKEFLPILELCKRLGATVMFNTNGTMIREKEARRVVKAGVDIMTLSLDGGTKETFERLRVGAKFDKILDNMRRLKKMKAQEKTQLPLIYIEFIAMRSNIHELPIMVDVAHEIGAHRLHVEPLVPYTEELEHERLHGYDEEPLPDIINISKQKAEEYGIELVGVGIDMPFNGVRDEPPVERAPAEAPVIDESAEPAPPLEPVLPTEDTDASTDEASSNGASSNGSSNGAAVDESEPAAKAEPTESADSTAPVTEPADEIASEAGAASQPGEESAEAEKKPDPRNEPIPEPIRFDMLGIEASGASGDGNVTLLCAQPFSQVYLEKDGKVRTCCYGTHDLGNLNEQSIEEIWNGPRFRALRRAMFTGQIPIECDQCVTLGRIPPNRYPQDDLVITPPDVVSEGHTLDQLAEIERTIDEVRKSFRLEIPEVTRSQDGRGIDLTLAAALFLDQDWCLETNIRLDAIQGREARELVPPIRVDIPTKLEMTRKLEIPIEDALPEEPWSLRVTVIENHTESIVAQAKAALAMPV